MTGVDNGNGERLDSWKAIASYLGRDAGTVRRWERTRGLPVHRVPGGKGSSVFAYTAEIDAWLQSAPQETPPDLPAPPPAAGAATPAVPPGRRMAGWRWAGASAGIAASLLFGWRMQQPSANAADLRIEVTPQKVTATTSEGDELWVHRLAADFIHPVSQVSASSRVIVGGTPAVYFITSHRESRTGNSVDSGELTSLDLDGTPRWSFRFDDTLRIGHTDYGAPWGVTAFAVNDAAAPRRIAVAAHHWIWGASVVAILDDEGRRLGTYANHGWLEQLHWVGRDRLAVGGFSQSRDGGLVALVDTTRLDAQTPEPDARHRCENCGVEQPLRVAVMPRSEINLATRSRFNRAILERMGDRVIARTVEVPPAGQGVADIIYEFSPDLVLVKASFSQRYWEVHDQLFAEKKLDHDRASCPDRDGPRPIHMWSAAEGWTMTAAR
jgi:hypothetical protein